MKGLTHWLNTFFSGHTSAGTHLTLYARLDREMYHKKVKVNLPRSHLVARFTDYASLQA